MVTTVTPMKRGLKDGAGTDKLVGQGVTTVTPMKRGLKVGKRIRIRDPMTELQPLPR